MKRRSSKCVVMLMPFLLAATGCGGASSTKDYTPSEAVGRQAIEAALSAWKSGSPMASVSIPDGPAVQPQDSDWKAGKKLVAYVIGDEKPTADGPKEIAVRLTFAGESSEINAVYYVVGQDPLWVFRDRDYQKATGM